MLWGALGSLALSYGSDLINELGRGGGSGGGMGSQAMKDAMGAYSGMMDLVQERTPGLTLAGMYSSAGLAGPGAGEEFRRREAHFGPTADAIYAASALRGTADMGMQQADILGRLGLTQADISAGKTRAQMANIASQMGSGPAGLAGLMGQFREQTMADKLAALKQAGGLSMQAQGQAAGMQTGAVDTLAKSKAAEHALHVDPYRVQAQNTLGAAIQGAAPIAQQAYGSQSEYNKYGATAQNLGQFAKMFQGHVGEGLALEGLGGFFSNYGLGSGGIDRYKNLFSQVG